MTKKGGKQSFAVEDDESGRRMKHKTMMVNLEIIVERSFDFDKIES
jgi:hypothetical protein